MGLVRSVFTKSRSIQSRQNSYARNNSNAVVLEKKRWRSSVRSYLCGDEHNAVEDDYESHIHEDVADLFSTAGTTNTSRGVDGTYPSTNQETASEATTLSVNQPPPSNSAYKLFQQDDAVLIIQSAFRRFQARRRTRDGKTMEEVKTSDDDEATKGSTSSFSRESVATSVEVQTGNSSDIFSSLQDEAFDEHCHQMRRKTQSQVLKIQEDWDDSTVSSVISKLRAQNRLEAATRRERALAYAFSQQLRICSKKKQCLTNGNEMKMDWNWLERWMAARQPENTLMEDQISSSNQTRKRIKLEGAVDPEKESCGSNEVSSLVEVTTINNNTNVSVPKNIPKPALKIRSKKVTTSLSRQGFAQSHLCPSEPKEIQKTCHEEDGKDNRERTRTPEVKELKYH